MLVNSCKLHIACLICPPPPYQQFVTPPPLPPPSCCFRCQNPPPVFRPLIPTCFPYLPPPPPSLAKFFGRYLDYNHKYQDQSPSSRLGEEKKIDPPEASGHKEAASDATVNYIAIQNTTCPLPSMCSARLWCNFVQ